METIFRVFLEAPAGPTEDFAPLTPFMIHIWRLHGLQTDSMLEAPAEREKFVYWFFDTFHRLRAPYRWPVPPHTLRWLNYPALEPSSGPGGKHYLTRFMLHVWKHFRQDMDVRKRDDYLRFLAWFALECVPAWNLPPALFPDDLGAVLNAPVRNGSPMSRGMQILGQLHGVPQIRDAQAAPDDLLLALSFEMLTNLLQSGDPRLVPDYISRFWTTPVSSHPGAPSLYQYLAARAWKPEVTGDDAIQSWYSRQFLTVLPQADSLCRVAAAPAGENGGDTLAPPDKVVFVYRDQHTIAGLSKAGLFTRDALTGAALPLVDLDFAFGRDRMLEEQRYNGRLLRHARSSLHIVNLNPEYVPECLMCHLSSLEHARYVIGQFYWELSDIGSAHECGLGLVDEIWVATEYLKDVYRKHVKVPVYVMGQAVEPPARRVPLPRSAFHLAEDDYIFLFTFDAGSGVERKNPLAAARAFQAAFGQGSEKASLILKTRNAGLLQSEMERAHWRQVLELAEREPRIRVMDSTLTGEQFAGLVAASDCYLSLHRSEGFGYGPAEAMALGKPAIATDYSGVTDFCTPQTALLVNYTLERVPPGAYPYMDRDRDYYWAAPDIEDAARHMRRLYEDRELGRELGQAGRELILSRYSVAALQQRYVDRLSALGWM
jgi:glycosyltransferase involved in cell wall biosynthesis